MKDKFERFVYAFLILILSLYPTYSALVYGFAHHQLEHHLSFLQGNSVYFNPWQYRVLAPILVEGFHQFLSHTFYKIFDPGNAYYSTFKIFRTIQHLLIYITAWYFYKLFTPGRPLRLIALIFLAGSFAAAAYRSDFAFNTYFDIWFYLIGVWLIFSNKNLWWLLPLTGIAALNRETSLLIPFLIILDINGLKNKSSRKRLILIWVSCISLYTIIFISIRSYYGYVAPASIGINTGLPLLLFNITDQVTILQLLATFSILPLYVLINIQKTQIRLQILFWLLVPAWFIAHFWLVWARETRLFLVPLVIVFIPIILDLIQRTFDEPKTEIL
jgi:hypothetical protein